MPESDRITVRIPDELLNDVDDAVRAGLYPNRSEAIRDAVREKFGDWQRASATVRDGELAELSFDAE